MHAGIPLARRDYRRAIALSHRLAGLPEIRVMQKTRIIPRALVPR
jgi:hypothetical protein